MFFIGVRECKAFGYVLNNPLLYNDPSGEIIVPILIGIGVAMLTTAIANISAGIPFWHGIGKAGVMGAITGAISFGIGSVAKSAFTNVLSRAAFKAGLTAFTSGTMSSLTGGSFGKGFINGFLTSAISSMVDYGVTKIAKEVNFQKGIKKLGLKPSDAVPQTDDFIAQAQAEWYPDAPKEALINHSVENVPEKIKAQFEANPGTEAAALPNIKVIDGERYFTGKGSIYYNPDGSAFTSARTLFASMGHELVHITQYKVMNILNITYNTYLESINGTRGVLEIMEYHAYNFQFDKLESSQLGGYNYRPDNWDEILTKYSHIHEAFDINTN